MSLLDEKLQKFQQAQKELYDHLGISRQLANREMSEVPGDNLHYNHISGNEDIPTAYPEVLDYRGRQFYLAGRGGIEKGDDEVLIPIDEDQPLEPSNVIRFNILSMWSYDDRTQIFAGTHLPKPDELEYGQADKVEMVEKGGIAWGDVCLLILDDPRGMFPQ